MNIIIMLLLLSVLILVHELGHFSVARALGMKVDRFGFGLPFGPTLYETKWGETTVCIHAFLLGGYVSFPDDDPESDIPQDDPCRISNRPVWQRFLVISAGVFANAIMAYIFVLIVAGFSRSLPAGAYDIFVDGLQDNKTLSAYDIGIQKDDKIISINKSSVDTPVKFIEIAQRSKAYDGFVSQEQYEKQLAVIKKLNPALKNIKEEDELSIKTKIKLPQKNYEEEMVLENGYIPGITQYKPSGLELSQEEKTLRDKIASKKQFSVNEKISLNQLVLATADNFHPVNITVNRGGELITLPSAFPDKEGMIGIKLKLQEVFVPIKSPVEVLTKSWDYLYKNTYLMVDGLAKLFTGQVPLKELHGIVAITKIGGDVIAQRGLWDGLLLTALISMDLAIVNLLPIPALDGGHLFFLLIEKIKGRPVEKETQEKFVQYGFVFLIGLMVLIIFNDIWALVTNKI